MFSQRRVHVAGSQLDWLSPSVSRSPGRSVSEMGPPVGEELPVAERVSRGTLVGYIRLEGTKTKYQYPPFIIDDRSPHRGSRRGWSLQSIPVTIKITVMQTVETVSHIFI